MSAAALNDDSIWGKKTFCVITGASRGIGEAIAIQFATKVGIGSLFVLIARSKPGLKRTTQLISESVAHVLVEIVKLDLSNPDPLTYMDIFCKSLSNRNLQPSQFDVAILVHNAGTLGPCKPMKVTENPDDFRHYFDTNVNSMLCLNAQFLRLFPSSLQAKRYVVNITSLLAIQANKKTGYYCAGKAAREMFMKVLAEEEDDVNVLQYSPGPVETELAVTLRKEMGEQFSQAMMSQGYLSCEQTVAKLVYILEKGSSIYKSGDHVDYFDVEIQEK